MNNSILILINDSISSRVMIDFICELPLRREEINITISPFRTNNFILNLSIDVPPQEDNTLLLLLATMEKSADFIPGIPNFILFAGLGLVAVVLIVIIVKKKKR